MFDLAKLSSRYSVRYMDDSDAADILDFCLQNTQYYLYCGKQPSLELIVNDLHLTPPNTPPDAKYYVGFYENGVLVAIMDLIDGYPDSDSAYIGFFMMNKRLQGRQIGSGIIRDLCRYIKETGISRIRLAIDKGNPQSTHFWKKNGFSVIKEVEQDGGTLLVAEKVL